MKGSTRNSARRNKAMNKIARPKKIMMLPVFLMFPFPSPIKPSILNEQIWPREGLGSRGNLEPVKPIR